MTNILYETKQNDSAHQYKFCCYSDESEVYENK